MNLLYEITFLGTGLYGQFIFDSLVLVLKNYEYQFNAVLDPALLLLSAHLQKFYED